jgi:peroxiredoxin
MKQIRRPLFLLAAGAIIALLGVQYLRLLRPAQAREVEAACRGLHANPVNKRLGRMPAVAPDFSAQDWTGKRVKLSDYRGKVVLLHFWGAWCVTCKVEEPSIEDLAGEMSGAGRDDIEVLAVASDDTWDEVRKEMPNGSNMHVLLDPSEDDQKIGPIARAFGVEALPESFIIDRDGIIKYYMDNRRDWHSDVEQTCLHSVIDE